MKISIITAVYNSIATLQNTIESIHSQSYFDIEHIIIDGNSNDGSAQIAKGYANSRCIVVSENDYGYYDALNKGISLAQGDVIGILNADDSYTDANLLNIVAKHFAADSRLDCIYGDLQYTAEKRGRKVPLSKWNAGEFSNQKLMRGWMPPHPTVFLRRSVYQKIGGFNLAFSISSDYDLILRAFTSSDFKSKYIPKLMVQMSLGGMSNQSWKNILIKMIEDYEIMKKNKLPAPYTLFLKNTSKWKQLRRFL